MAYTDSAVVTGSVTLEGVWIHDPADPEGTVRQYKYGKASRSGDLEVAAQESVYAGREYPVVDFGEFTSEQVEARIDVPFGPSWADDLAALRAFVLARRPVVFRDNRGRCVQPAALSALRDQDMETGTQVALRVSRADG